MREREPLDNPDPNPTTSWLHGESWAIGMPVPDALGDAEGKHEFLDVHSDEECGHVYLTFASHPEDGYWVIFNPVQARLRWRSSSR